MGSRGRRMICQTESKSMCLEHCQSVTRYRVFENRIHNVSRAVHTYLAPRPRIRKCPRIHAFRCAKFSWHHDNDGDFSTRYLYPWQYDPNHTALGPSSRATSATRQIQQEDTHEYAARVGDMTPEMDSSSLLTISDSAASGRPQFATCKERTASVFLRSMNE
jgi:hypothetical protein